VDLRVGVRAGSLGWMIPLDHQAGQLRGEVSAFNGCIEQVNLHVVWRHARLQISASAYVGRLAVERGRPVAGLQIVADVEGRGNIALVEQHEGDLVNVVLLVYAVERSLIAFEFKRQHEATLEGRSPLAQERDSF
jgi:hypothetical protein